MTSVIVPPSGRGAVGRQRARERGDGGVLRQHRLLFFEIIKDPHRPAVAGRPAFFRQQAAAFVAKGRVVVAPELAQLEAGGEQGQLVLFQRAEEVLRRLARLVLRAFGQRQRAAQGAAGGGGQLPRPGGRQTALCQRGRRLGFRQRLDREEAAAGAHGGQQ